MPHQHEDDELQRIDQGDHGEDSLLEGEEQDQLPDGDDESSRGRRLSLVHQFFVLFVAELWPYFDFAYSHVSFVFQALERILIYEEVRLEHLYLEAVWF